MAKNNKSKQTHGKWVVIGLALALGGAGLYLFMTTQPASGVAMNGIAIGLAAVAGLALILVGTLTSGIAAALGWRAKRKQPHEPR